MPADLKLLLPPYFKDIYEFGILVGAEETELDAAEKSMERVKQNLYVQTCDDMTLREYEQLLGVLREPGAALDSRRRAVLSRMNQQLPYSLPKLKEMLNAAFGREWYRLDVRYNVYQLELDVIDQPYQALKNMQYTVEEMIPAHLLFIFAGLYPTQISITVTAESRLELASDFYARYNREFLYLDGTWLLDVGYSLNGYREKDFPDLYPARLAVAGSFHTPCSCGVPGVKSMTDARAAPDTRTILQVEGAAKSSQESRNVMAVQAGIQARPDMEFHLRVEKDLWYLDGMYLLDGTKLLDAEIFKYNL